MSEPTTDKLPQARETCLNLCASCKHRLAPPSYCAQNAQAANLAREGSRVDSCSLYNGHNGLRSVQEEVDRGR